MNVFLVGTGCFIAGAVIMYLKYAPIKKELVALKTAIVAHAIALEGVIKGDVTKVKDEAEKLLNELKAKL